MNIPTTKEMLESYYLTIGVWLTEYPELRKIFTDTIPPEHVMSQELEALYVEGNKLYRPYVAHIALQKHPEGRIVLQAGQNLMHSVEVSHLLDLILYLDKIRAYQLKLKNLNALLKVVSNG